MRRFNYFFISLLVSTACIGQNSIEDIFRSCKVDGSVSLYSLSEKNWHFTDSIDAAKPSLPASTFKIINTLIALQERIISSVNDTIQFNNREVDTSKYGFRPKTYRNVTVTEAFKESIVWAYMDLAKNISPSTYLKYLDKIEYGNSKFEIDRNDFWNFGEFEVTPIQQINFLIKLYKLELPFDKNYQVEVKNMLFEGSNNGYKIYGKTGWTRSDSMYIGWWVGFMENDKDTVFFVTRIKRPIAIDSKGFGDCRKEITLKVIAQTN